MSRKLSMVAIIALALCVTGCASVRAGVHNTLSDTMDIVRVDVSGSFGTDMGAHVMITKFAQLKSYSYEDLYRAGFGTRHMGVWKEEREDWWVGQKHARNMTMNMHSVAEIAALSSVFKMRGGPSVIEQYVMESPDEVGLGVHLFVVGARAGVRPLEFVDLLANFVGLDPCKDNASWNEVKMLRMQRKTAREAKKNATKTDNTVPAPAPAPDTDESEKPDSM